MLIVDASALYEVIVGSPKAAVIRSRMLGDGDLHAPHLIDAEVLSVIQRHHQRGLLDATAARQSVVDLALWPARRWDHRRLLERCWDLRANVRGYDALYVALAESLGGTLLTCDLRLARATGPTCPIDVV